jgi:hypothetical protein
MKYHAGVLVLIVDRVSLSFGMVCGLRSVVCGCWPPDSPGDLPPRNF